MSSAEDSDGPMQRARRAMRPKLPLRFYERVSVDARAGGFVVLLDGRPVRTPGKRRLAVPTAALAELVAAEWRSQGERVDPATMPVTRIVNTGLDGVAGNETPVIDDIVRYAGSDLLCYRADQPPELVERQSAAWDPILARVEAWLGSEFRRGVGVIPFAQPEPALDAVRAAVVARPPLALAALHVLTTLAGSAVLALAHAGGRIDAETAWRAAHVDEDWQIAHWGEDRAATLRRANRKAEFMAACAVLRHGQ